MTQIAVGLANTARAASRRDGEFAAYSVPRERRISKYSLQRAFGELWYVDRNWDDWKFGPAREPLALEEVAPVKLLPRRIGYPTFAMSRPFRVLKGVRTRWNAEKKVRSSDFIDGLDDPKYEPYYRGSRLFRRAELKANLWDEMQRIENVAERAVADADSFALADGDGGVFDCGLLSTGFLGVRVKCVRPGCLYALFDELPTEDRDVNPTRLGAANVVKWDLREAGEYALEAFEPYEMKALKLVRVLVAAAMFTLVTLFFPIAAESVPAAGIFAFFGVMMVFHLLWVIFFVPETRGRKLEDIA